MLVGIGIRESDCRLIYGLNQALKKEALFCIIEENKFCHTSGSHFYPSGQLL